MPRPVFLAHADGPPKLRLYLYRDDDFEYRGRKMPGPWHIVVDRMVGNDWEPQVDYVEEEFMNIREYPSRYAPDDIVWRDEATGEIVNLDAMELRGSNSE